MSLPAKERVYKIGLSIPITRPETDDNYGSFEFSYAYLDSGRTFNKEVKLTLLGRSHNTDMITGDYMTQMIATDQSGELYNVAIEQDFIVAVRDVRTTKFK